MINTNIKEYDTPADVVGELLATPSMARPNFKDREPGRSTS